MNTRLVPLLWEVDDTATDNPYVQSEATNEFIPPAFSSIARPEKGEQSLNIPQHNELQVIRHFTRLAELNFSIDTQMYPLGSCTMKYNPRVNDVIAGKYEFSSVHPQSFSKAQGSLEALFGLQQQLSQLSGFPAVSLNPAAGAQGELAGVMMIRKYHEQRGDFKRKVIIVPDSAHGTNPATVSMCGLKVKTVASDSLGHVDMTALTELLGDDVAGMMLTNPNTLGIFEDRVVEITRLVHEAGGLMYGDGANFNAIAGIVRPADLGFDVMHFNLHKTFGTPHGGGGPGAGPVGCSEVLSEFLPGPIVKIQDGNAASGENTESNTQQFEVYYAKSSIGRLKTGFGNFGILLRAYAYIFAHGIDGVRKNSETAVLKANYLRNLLREILPAQYSTASMHEFVASNPKKEQVSTMDIAKALLDRGYHAPTVYFPLTVKEALMIEPTESESYEEIQSFSEALKEILELADSNPDALHEAPVSTVLGRLDEVLANRKPVLRHIL